MRRLTLARGKVRKEPNSKSFYFLRPGDFLSKSSNVKSIEYEGNLNRFLSIQAVLLRK